MPHQPRTPWGGQPAELLQKVALVNEDDDRLPVYTLTFSTPAGSESLGISMRLGDVVKVCVPNYKPKSYSVSSERPGSFDITLKVYPNGRASGYLDRVQIGETIDVFGLSKRKRRIAGSHVGFIAYGVGITEALPIAAAELASPEAPHVRLLWASRTMGDTFWRDQIDALKEAYGERFSVQYILSREEREGSLLGRVNAEVLYSVFDGHWGTAKGEMNAAQRPGVRYLSVGTKEMMRDTDCMLAQIGYPMRTHALLQ